MPTRSRARCSTPPAQGLTCSLQGLGPACSGARKLPVRVAARRATRGAGGGSRAPKNMEGLVSAFVRAVCCSIGTVHNRRYYGSKQEVPRARLAGGSVLPAVPWLIGSGGQYQDRRRTIQLTGHQRKELLLPSQQTALWRSGSFQAVPSGPFHSRPICQLWEQPSRHQTPAGQTSAAALPLLAFSACLTPPHSALQTTKTHQPSQRALQPQLPRRRRQAADGSLLPVDDHCSRQLNQ